MNFEVKITIPYFVNADTDKIKDKNIKKKIVKKLKMLQQNPDIGERLTGDLSGLYKVRADNYRIVYEKITDPATKTIQIIITVIMIEHRKDIYNSKVKKQILKRFENTKNTLH